jgi:hypothetical protein
VRGRSFSPDSLKHRQNFALVVLFFKADSFVKISGEGEDARLLDVTLVFGILYPDTIELCLAHFFSLVTRNHLVTHFLV